ncbi:C-X-C chemokine receptor type 5 [Erythrolamprus reginae]|uniref:C-X-C chemokine receptor type 5 n=1 Tax=Erythrolamprus reginae TaxID=121349 RepID=UPI00396C6DF4
MSCPWGQLAGVALAEIGEWPLPGLSHRRGPAGSLVGKGARRVQASPRWRLCWAAERMETSPKVVFCRENLETSFGLQIRGCFPALALPRPSISLLKQPLAELHPSEVMAEFRVTLENVMNWTFDYNLTDSNFSYDEYMCPQEEGSPRQRLLQSVLVSFAHLLIFLLGGLGNLLVVVILWRYRRSRTSTELFLLHFALANLLLLLTFPFGVAQGLAGWVFGLFLCKLLSVTKQVSFYSSSLLLGCISVDRYLAVVCAVQTFQKQRGLSVHLTCLGIWLLSFLLAVPNLLFTEVWVQSHNLSICHFREYGPHGINSWLAQRFLYHLVGFLLPLGVMGYCYTAIVRLLCQSQRLQRQKAVKVAIAVTSVFLLCWTPYNVVIFWDTLAKQEVTGKSCTVDRGLSSAIIASEVLAYSHCCLNPILYAFVGVRFRHDLCRMLHRAGCLSQGTLQQILGPCGVESSTETNLSSARHGASSYSGNAMPASLLDQLTPHKDPCGQEGQAEGSEPTWAQTRG